jgi:hypothetical protein
MPLLLPAGWRPIQPRDASAVAAIIAAGGGQLVERL